jgi:uncharacterized membrane protein (UPF0136 family)
MEILNHVLDFLSTINPVVLTTLAIVVEFALRFVKSAKPLSIIYMIGGALKTIGAICTKLGEISDKVLPQKTKV